MAAVYSRRFSDGLYGGDNTSHALFTVPAGRVYVVRFVTVWSYTHPSTAFIQGPSGSRWAFYTSTADSESFNADVRLVLTAGEVLSWYLYSGSWHVSTHGFDFAA